MAFDNTQIGTKGSDVYTATGVDDPRVALSALLVQGASHSTIVSGVDAVLISGEKEMIEDLFVLLFQTRDIRGGKGIRDVSFIMEKHLLMHPRYKKIMLHLLDLLPEYGSWRDILALLASTFGIEFDEEVRARLVHLVAQQLQKDEKDMAESKPISLLAKWMPREGSSDDDLAKYIASYLFFPRYSKMSQRMKAYRKCITPLNKYLDTTEVKMCANTFADIDPAKVPGRALQNYTRVFLNETLEKVPHGSVYRPRMEYGVRYPRDEDRNACAQHFREYFEKAVKGEVKINGSKTVYPHELIKKVHKSMNQIRYSKEMACNLSQEEKNAVIAVWNQIVKDAKEGGGLRRSLAMCDFSGSMQSSDTNGDTPYWVSMAMGFLISEVSSNEFQDVFLTFDSEPTFHCLPKGDIFHRASTINTTLAQGTSTDFQKAMDLVLGRCKERRVRPGEEPEYLIVLTDMNWDAACGSHEQSAYTGNQYRHVVKTEGWQTHIEMIREAFKRAGEDMWGQGLKMPTIVIWNIAGTSKDFHARADTEGVVMLSGWSPTLFKVLQTEGIKEWTPYRGLRQQLDDPRYDIVRTKVRECMVVDDI